MALYAPVWLCVRLPLKASFYGPTHTHKSCMEPFVEVTYSHIPYTQNNIPSQLDSKHHHPMAVCMPLYGCAR